MPRTREHIAPRIVTTHPAGSGSSAQPPLRFRGFDGLRALAVIAVIGYHAKVPGFAGGFLGVDLFFVISGYLVTSLVLAQVARTGRVEARAFYRRRIRRLLPALVLLLGAVAAAQLLLRDQLEHLRSAVPAALAGVANWQQVLVSQSYFDAAHRPSLLRHLWSLAIEAQFYLVLPALAWLALRVGRRWLAALLTVLAVASAAWMILASLRSGVAVSSDPTRVYVGTDTHLFPLAAGAALACLWRPWTMGGERIRRTGYDADVLVATALVAFGLGVVTLNATDPRLWRGGYAVAAAVCVLLVAAVAHPGSTFARALDSRIPAWIGERSYGLYLWHWPLLMVLRPDVDVPWSAPVAVAVALGLTVLLAEASYRWVETPIRRGALVRWWGQVRDGGLLAPAATRTSALLASALILALGLGVAVATLPDRVSVLEASDRLAGGAGIVTAAAPVAPVASTAPHRPTSLAQLAPEPDAPAESTPTEAPERPGPTAKLAPEPSVLPEPSAPAPASAPEPAPSPTEELGTVTAIGDSVFGMVAPDLIALGPVTLDWAVSRQFAPMVDIALAMRDAGTLGHTVVVHGGSNGPIGEADLRRLLDGLGDRRVFLVNDRTRVEYRDQNNALLTQVVPQYPNASVIDWFGYSDAHPEWFYDDATHPREGTGTVEMANLVWGAIQP